MSEKQINLFLNEFMNYHKDRNNLLLDHLEYF